MSQEFDFTCQKCGKECDSAPALPERAVCEECCEQVFEEHDHHYVPGERDYWCDHCGKPAPYEWISERSTP
jgi:DNA-directed RNA polymerase subunit RPC12/RpoP